ncbi:MAG: PRD domain-containing protein [Olsenella sp.]|jgi:transcriptional antiterminator
MKDEGMDDLEQRIEILQQSGFFDESGRKDIEAMIRVLTEKYGFPRNDETLGVLVTHVAAALKRQKDGEEIDPIDAGVLEDVKSSEVYPEAKKIQEDVIAAMEHKLPEDEKDFILVHVGGLLMNPDVIAARRGEAR